jgi:hypothetical protein
MTTRKVPIYRRPALLWSCVGSRTGWDAEWWMVWAAGATDEDDDDDDEEEEEEEEEE